MRTFVVLLTFINLTVFYYQVNNPKEIIVYLDKETSTKEDTNKNKQRLIASVKLEEIENSLIELQENKDKQIIEQKDNSVYTLKITDETREEAIRKFCEIRRLSCTNISGDEYDKFKTNNATIIDELSHYREEYIEINNALPDEENDTEIIHLKQQMAHLLTYEGRGMFVTTCEDDGTPCYVLKEF